MRQRFRDLSFFGLILMFIKVKLQKEVGGMAYKRSVYIKAKNVLEARRTEAERQRDARHSAALLKCSELEKTEQEMADCATAVIKSLAMGGDSVKFIEELSKKSLETQKKRKDILKNAGFPENYLDVKYTCPICRDTGSHDGYYCDCYKKLIRETARKEFSAYARLDKCTFETFKTSCYPDVADSVLGVSQREHMTNVFEYCKEWAKDFSRRSSGLIMLGKTGLGKTHLSLAIAGTVIDKGYNVYYGSVQNIMNRLEKEHFGKSIDEVSIAEDLYESDLLILDDLGAEFSTQFTVAQLYNILNTRMINSLPVIISTNLSMQEIEDKYSQRVASRLVGNTIPIQFCGKDIRQIINS